LHKMPWKSMNSHVKTTEFSGNFRSCLSSFPDVRRALNNLIFMSYYNLVQFFYSTGPFFKIFFGKCRAYTFYDLLFYDLNSLF
jgi:hypothetical protein